MSAIALLLAVLIMAPSAAGVATSPGLQATAGVGYVDLNWSAVADADGYTIYRLGDGGLQRLVNVTVPFTSYHDTNVEEGSNYVYCITAWHELNESAPSNTVSVTVLAEKEDNVILPILAIVLSIIAIQVCIVMLLYFSKQKMQLK
jgi:fibronectin type 3 domain-containing protein